MHADERRASATRPSSSSKMRPQSRASSTSTHSAATQPNMDSHDFSSMSGMYPADWQQLSQMQPGQPGYPGQAGQSGQPSQPGYPGQAGQQGQPGHSANGDDVLLLQQVNNPETAANHFPMNNMNGMNTHPMPSQFPSHQMQAQHQMQQAQHRMQVQHQMHAQHQIQAQQQLFHPQTWSNENSIDGDSSLNHANVSVNGGADHGATAGKSKLSKKRSNANNDGEMRDLFQTNRESKLDDVAKELRGNERGPNAERKRQLYAMLWLDSACVESKSSIPRSRVYHMYASQCTDDRVMVLNPASFGKLVRVVFPAIKTRRLGVRGESKYHYCNFQLRDPPPPEMDVPRGVSVAAPDAPAQAPEFDFNALPTQQNDDQGAGRLPSPEDAPHPRTTDLTSWSGQGSRSHSRYVAPHLKPGEHPDGIPSTTPIKLRLPTPAETELDPTAPLMLPPIDPFLPPQTDKDAADSLAALYRAQCTSIVESFRFLRDKSFFHLYTSFHGTLTMPVQKLFAHPSIAAWIEECDIVLYQRLTMFTFNNSLSAVPKVLLNRMRTIAERLVSHIIEVFHGQPEHVVRAKVVPAAMFAGILERMIRVNMTAHAASSCMAVEANRDQMYEDWQEFINPRKIAQNVPSRGMDDVVELLVKEIRDLIDPTQIDMDASASLPASAKPPIVNRWRKFLMSLPERFPYASHADIVWCVDRVGGAITREVTIRGGSSFSSWWVAKTFIDEDLMFLAEFGGFLHTKKVHSEALGPQTAAVVTENGQKEASTDRDDVEMGGTSHEPVAVSASPGRSDRAPFPPKHTQAADVTGDVHEDSGIGIRTPETDFPIDKFTFTEPENPELEY